MKMKYLFLLILIPSVCLAQSKDAADGYPFPVSTIYETEEYSAFPDIVRFNKAFYVSFRVGSDHVGGKDGKVRIIRSEDGVQWENVALLEKEGIDLRDPKLSITPDGKLMVILGGSVYKDRKLLGRYPHVSFSNEGDTFSNPEEVKLIPEGRDNESWIWRVTWNKGIGYGIDYQTKNKDAWEIYLTKTTDGKTFDRVSQLHVDGQPNEATVRFDKDNNMYVLIRREDGDKVGMIAKSSYPYTDWSYEKLDLRLGGPNFLVLNKSELVMGTRKYTQPVATQIMLTDLKGVIKKQYILPSGGDNSYPGLIIHKKHLWVVYYSSHEGNSNIYLTKIPLKDLK